ncbi:MAG: DNA mismatch repair protein MutS, partial [Pyrinomonadaceae bacterium]|nr:DNA mismatch repair protein MutS [Pyrinomonadaceae bacterium]
MENTTPMLRQYLEIKKNYPGTILFFRLGDFYEMFNDDAIIGSRELEITLTARQKDSPRPIPMCGVPHHAAANYIARLVKKGYRVAICDQTETAGKDIKLVKREVVRIITPGTAIDEQLIESKENVYLSALCGSGEQFGASFLDLSTGEFFTTQISGQNAWQKIVADIESFSPRELLFPESLRKLVENTFANSQNQTLSDASNVVSLPIPNSNKFSATLTALDDWSFHLEDCENLLKAQLNVKELTGYGLSDKNEAIRSAGACLRYAKETQRASAEHISDLNFFEANDFLVLDAVTLKNLELVESKGENNRRTLFSVIDETVTGMGARLLKSWLLRPSIKRSEIQTRLLAVQELCDSILRDKIRYLLKEIADLERLVGRLNLGTAIPRDLLALNRSLSQTPNINLTLSDAQSLLLQVLSENIFELPEIRNLIERSIADEPPMNVADGGVIRIGFNQDLDELRNISVSAKQVIASIEEREKQRTNIQNLKIKFNNVFGYFIEISKSNLNRVPEDYERRQTLANAERYTTPELKELETKVLGAEEKILELEVELFKQIRAEVQKETRNLQSTARALATLDALCSLAETATKRNFVPPILHDGDEIEIKDGRHPIVEAFSNEQFIPNDLTMNNSTDRLLIITGPNMGGKSTNLRQVALIQILAQIGSFVPAKSAKLPILDRIWTRVGASDDLASGRSTLMVEMTETAAILHNATPRSLILLDEIGRGTSTFDGLSIAWSVAEYLHNSPEHSAKTLFATHYHELTELAENLAGAKNYQITATEKDGEVVFLHKLEKGKANKSYGIAVAQL